MSIPPKSWGAVEIIIWNHQKYLEKVGHTVTVFNTRDLESVATAINRGSFDFVHLQYDVHTAFFADHLKQKFYLTSHYGYLPQVDKWDDTYKQLFKDSFRADGIIALSKQGRDVWVESGYKKPLAVLRNGVELDEIRFSPRGNGKAVCVGNVLPRKRQALLAEALRNKVFIDFYGPNFKPGVTVSREVVHLLPGAQLDFASVSEEGELHENETARYRGVWKKQDLYDNLTNYSCLVLISESENDPLVVKEALAAGLSVVVSEAAAANLTEAPFITVLSEEEIHSEKLAKSVVSAVAENYRWREDIRCYASVRFDYSAVVHDYVLIMEEFTGAKIGVQPKFRTFSTPLPRPVQKAR